jgi:hypothetical protein
MCATCPTHLTLLDFITLIISLQVLLNIIKITAAMSVSAFSYGIYYKTHPNNTGLTLSQLLLASYLEKQHGSESYCHMLFLELQCDTQT